MDLETYEELTGITVPANQQGVVEAQILKAQKILEGMLGYTLDPTLVDQNLYIELGKSPTECPCPSVEPENLLPPDAVVFAYRLFPYNNLDKYLETDPFTSLYKVKLVRDDVTVKTFTEEEIRAQWGGQGWGKYIENCKSLCVCLVECRCVQLAVDAEWLFACDSSVGDPSIGCVSDEILYIWADMVTYYVDCKKDVKSESIGSHSYTKFDRDVLPQDERGNLAILKKYAGPNGTLKKVITV